MIRISSIRVLGIFWRASGHRVKKFLTRVCPAGLTPPSPESPTPDALPSWPDLPASLTAAERMRG